MKDLKVFLKDIRKHSPRVFRRSHPRRCSTKKNFLRNFAKFTGKHLCQSLFLERDCSFIEKATLAQVFSCDFCEYFKSTLSYKTPPAAGSLSL